MFFNFAVSVNNGNNVQKTQSRINQGLISSSPSTLSRLPTKYKCTLCIVIILIRMYLFNKEWLKEKTV